MQIQLRKRQVIEVHEKRRLEKSGCNMSTKRLQSKMWSSTSIKRYVQVSVQSFRPEIKIMKKDLSGCDRRMNEKVQIGVQNLEVEQSENDMGQRFGEFHIHEVYAHIHKNTRSPLTSVQCDMCNCRRMTAVGGISCMRPDAIDTIAQHGGGIGPQGRPHRP